MQWMNQSGTLKITNKVRVKFSIGNYVDTVDCDVAPLSACHLLLGRPWQFDLDATHGGRSNSYSFMHKGIHHVLKPMLDSAIKAEVFAPVKAKKKGHSPISKPRSALLQEGENGVNVPTLHVDVSEPAVSCKEQTKPTIQFGSISINVEKKVGNSLKTIGGSYNVGVVAVAADQIDEHQIGAPKIVALNEHQIDDARAISKPRTALFQGREDDEPRTHQDIYADKSSSNLNIAASNSLISSGLRFGTIYFDVKYDKNTEKFTSTGLSSNMIFRGLNFHKKKEEKKERIYIYIGSMQVHVDDVLPT
jgi:hypothetical protein